MMNYIKQKGAAVYFFLCILIFSFVCYRGYELAPFIDFPHISVPFLPVYVILLFTFIFGFLLCCEKDAEIDIITLLLLLRLGLHFIPVLYNGLFPHFFIHFFTSVMGLFAYLIAKNFSNNNKSVLIAFRAFFVILVVQIIGESFLGSQSFWGDPYFYKNDLVLPIGASNALASKIIPAFALIFISLKTNRMKSLFFLLALFSVILTKSRGGIVDLFMVFIIVTTWKGYFSFNIFLRCVIPLLIVMFFVYFLSNTEYGALMFSDSDSTVLERLDLWKAGVELFFNHPFWGNGFYYMELADNPHNFMLDILMRSGLVGFGVFCVIVIYFILCVKNFLVDDLVRGCFVAVLCLLIQGFVEIVLFTYIHDFMLWTLLGFMMSRLKTLNKTLLGEG